MPRLLVLDHDSVWPEYRAVYGLLASTHGWQVTLAGPSSFGNLFERKIDHASPVPTFPGRYVTVPVRWRFSTPLHCYLSTLVPLLRREKPDVIYVHHEAYMVATAQMFAANAVTGRVPIGVYAAQNIEKRYPLPFRAWERWILQTSAFAFVVSREAATLLVRKGLRCAPTLLPLYVDREMFHPHPAAAEVRQHLRCDADTLLLGYVGRLVEAKGLDTLLRAMASLQHRSWRLALVGGGPMQPVLAARARELGVEDRIAWVPPQDKRDLAPYMSAFDVLVLPSETRAGWKEQFGRVIVEAMACGTPVIGSSSGAIPEVIEATGGGLVFPEGDASALADAVARLRDDPELRRRLGHDGRVTSLELYAMERVADRMGRHLAAVLRRPTSAAEPPFPVMDQGLG